MFVSQKQKWGKINELNESKFVIMSQKSKFDFIYFYIILGIYCFFQ